MGPVTSWPTLHYRLNKVEKAPCLGHFGHWSVDRQLIQLMTTFSLPEAASGMALALEIYDKVSSPLATSLLTTHPNQATLGACVPDSWSSWWDWAAEHDQDHPKWIQLLEYYCRPNEKDDCSPPTSSCRSTTQCQIPPQLCRLIDTVRGLQLARDPTCSVLQGSSLLHINRRLTRIAPTDSRRPSCKAHKTRGRSPSSFGMSPKKEHEVYCMASFIRSLLKQDDRHPSVQHVVDVGSGQVSTIIPPIATSWRRDFIPYTKERGIYRGPCRNRAYMYSLWIAMKSKHLVLTNGKSKMPFGEHTNSVVGLFIAVPTTHCVHQHPRTLLEMNRSPIEPYTSNKNLWKLRCPSGFVSVLRAFRLPPKIRFRSCSSLCMHAGRSLSTFSEPF